MYPLHNLQSQAVLLNIISELTQMLVYKRCAAKKKLILGPLTGGGS